MDSSAIEQVANLVREARHIAVLSGAGISTASGIPDFRSASGLYSDDRNTNVFDLAEFHRNPEHFYRFAREFYPKVIAAQPNGAHLALARWEKAGRHVEIATQNVDDFHQRAGSQHVYPVHGSFVTSTCVECSAACRTSDIAAVIARGDLPRCACGGVFKPDITFFGELLPVAAWESSVRAMSSADLVLVLGTSLVVYPAASLPDHRRPDAGLVVINHDATALDSAADVAIHDDLPEVMEAITARLGFCFQV